MFNTSVADNQAKLSNFVAVLLVDSCPANLEAYRHYLQQDVNHAYSIVEALTLQDALPLGRSHDFDVIILAINLSDGSGLELLREMNSRQPGAKLPVIIVTRAGELELTLQAMKLGASDYLIAENITADSLCQSINYVIEQINLVRSDRQKIEIALQQLNEELEQRIEARTADLQRSENRLQDVLQFARITNWQLDPVTKKYIWSPEILNILRIDPADEPLTYDQMANHFTLDSKQLRENFIDRLIKYGEPYVTTFQIIRGDCTVGHVLSKARPHFNEQGEIIQISGIMMDISEWQEAEEKFKNSEQRFATLANTIPVAIFCLNQQGECIYVNDFWSQITGRSITNTLGKPWLEVVHPQDQNRIKISWVTILNQSSFYQTEGRTLRPDGSICWFYCQIVREFDTTGKHIGYIGTLTDISDRKVNEQTLRDLSTRLKLAVKSAHIGIWEFDLIQDRIIWNSRMYELYNLSPLEIDLTNNALTKFYSFIHPDDLPDLSAQMEAVGRKEKDLDTEFRIIWHNGTVRNIKVSAILTFDDDQKPKSMIGVNYDITKRKETEKEILRSRDLWQAVFNESADAIFLVNSETLKFIDCNVRSVEMFEANSKDDLMGLRGNDLHKKKLTNLEIQDIYNLLNQQGFWNAEIEYISLKGKTFWGNVFVKPIVVAGQMMNMVRVTDITERKRVADQLRATNTQLAEATRLKDEFLANMSHELRTPLNAILGMSEGILEQVFGPITPAQEKAIKLIKRSGKHLLDLINDILDLSKIQAGELTLDFDGVSLSNLCCNSTDLVEQIAGTKNIQLSTQIVTEIEHIWADERRIRQVLLNLLSNAIKFTPPGGQVSLVVTEAEGEILFSITDTGIGIDQAHLQNIFEPFVQIDSSLNRQHAGTGLGLALVEKIVNQHEGNITVNSTVGKGSCFTVHLPYYPLCMLRCDDKQSSENHTSIIINYTTPERSPVILLADDHEGNQQTMEDYLVHKGYQILLANNGEEAIALTKIHRPDLILMDIQMPRLTGLEAITLIRSDTTINHIPIIAITALALAGDAERCLKAGANQYLTKPVQFKILLETIENILSPSPYQDQNN